ncbi:MAG: hypothetical protein R3F61_06725 [Myxococcota bacterium]
MIAFLVMSALAGTVPQLDVPQTPTEQVGAGCRHVPGRSIGYAAAALGFVIVGLSRRKRAPEPTGRRYRTPLDDLEDQERERKR